MDEEILSKLSKDLKQAVTTMTNDEARFLVDAYYQMQDNRIRATGQIRSIDQGVDPVPSPEPTKRHQVLDWLADNNTGLENQIKNALHIFAKASKIGQWSLGIVGIGPVISAGLIAHINLEKAPTVGHIWRYAGLDPTQRWVNKEEAEKFFKEHGADFELAAKTYGLRAEVLRHYADGKTDKKSFIAALKRRPWNASLKTLCWKIGESFVKVSGNKDDIYGKIYLQRKALETEKNEAGGYAAQAAAGMERVSKSTDAWKAYSQGKLPAGHLHSRAKRYAVKLFLSHWHGQAYQFQFGKEPPLPYPIAILGHAHLISAIKTERTNDTE